MGVHLSLPPLLLMGLSAIMLAACASAGPPPTSALNQARYAVQQADHAEANRYAKQSWLRAHEELNQAKQLVSNKDASHQDYVHARRLAEKAQVDAQLATAQSKAQRAQAQAKNVQANIQSLKKELSGNVGQQ